MTPEEAQRIVDQYNATTNSNARSAMKKKYEDALSLLQSQASSNAVQAGESDTVDEHGKYTDPDKKRYWETVAQDYTDANRANNRNNLEQGVANTAIGLTAAGTAIGHPLIGAGVGTAAAKALGDRINEYDPSEEIQDTPETIPQEIETQVYPDATVPTETPTEQKIESANEEAVDILQNDEEAPAEEKKAAKRYSDATMSITDAYANGLIDKSTRDYLIVDAVATFAKNLGRQIGNVGAQFTGGTIDNTVDESKWDSRNAAKWNQEQQMELENAIGSPEWRQKEAELKSLTSQDLANEINAVKSKYTEQQIQQNLKMLAQQYDLGSLNKKIMEGKISAAEVFEEMQKDATSELGRLGFGLLTTFAYGGGSGLAQMASAAGSFLPW